MTEQIGRVLGGRYRLLAPIGAGASAEVYLADDVRLRRQVAVKVLHAALADDPSFLRRFRAEAQAAAALNHGHILAVFDWSRDEDTSYLVTEYLSGGSLRSLLDAGHRLTPSQALVVGLEASRALDHAHRQGFVHRDVKPANLLFGGDGRLRIADFGLARAIAEAAWTEPEGALLGTARYASPEQARGETVDGHSDVYALALVLIEAVTGVVPFTADTTVGTLMSRVDRPLDVPEELGPLRPVVERAGHPEPSERLDADGLGRALMEAAPRLRRPAPLPLVGTAAPASRPQATSGETETLVGPAPVPDAPAGPNGDGSATSDPTAMLPVAPPAAPAVEPGDGEGAGVGTLAPPRHARPPRVPSRRWLRLALLAVGAVSLGVIGAVIVQQSRVPTHEVPLGLIGAQRSEIPDHVGDFGWRIDIEERHQDGTAEGEILSTDPDPGSSLSEGETLTVVVSLGPPLAEVPQDLQRLAEDAAVERLRDAGFEVEVAEQPSEDIEPGYVVGLGDDVEDRMPAGATVTLVVSSGPPPVEIPDVRGLDLDEAVDLLEEAGLEAVTRRDPFLDGEPGEVVASDPGPGQEVPRGTTVQLTVPEAFVEVPDIKGEDLDDAIEELEDAGLRVGEIRGSRSGEVRSTDPSIGDEVPAGTEIDIRMRR